MLLIAYLYRDVGTGPADPATAGQQFPVHQESPQLILYINFNQATLTNFILQLHVYTKAIVLLYNNNRLLYREHKILTSLKH